MSEWFKMNPVDWNEGTNALTLEQEAAYLRICNAIYIAGGPISNNKFVVAGLLRCNDRKAKRLVNELIEAGKLTIEDGLICNRRALDEVSNRSRLQVERQSAGSRGGTESAKARTNALKNNKAHQASASGQNEPDKIREDKRRGKEEPNGSSKSRGSRLPDDWMPDEVFARSEGMAASEIDREAAMFRDFWRGQPGQRGVKLDWQATWRNWVRKAVRDRYGKREPSPQNWRQQPEYRGVL